MVEDKDTVTIVVNGREKVIPSADLTSEGELSFVQVVKLAFDPPPSGPDIVFTVSYRNGAGRPPGREARRGQERQDRGRDHIQCLIH